MNGYFVPTQAQTQPMYGGPPSGGQVVYPNTPPTFADLNQNSNYLPPVNIFQPVQQIHPLQYLQPVQQIQQIQPVQLFPQQVFFQHQPSAMTPCSGGACYPGLSSCWMHRPPGQMMHLPPPPAGRPGQWVQWHSGEVIWLAPRSFVQ